MRVPAALLLAAPFLIGIAVLQGLVGKAAAPSIPGAFTPLELDCASVAFVRQR
jgi:hypothetical protein